MLLEALFFLYMFLFVSLVNLARLMSKMLLEWKQVAIHQERIQLQGIVWRLVDA